MRHKSSRKKGLSSKNTKQKTPPPPPEKHLGHARDIFIWTFVLLTLFAVLGVLASQTTPTEKSPFPKKLPMVSTLSLGSSEEETISILATGDVMLARFVELRMRKAKDYTLPFRNIADFLKPADITFGNLETPIIPGANSPTGSFMFRADPESVQGLTFAGYDVMSIANNHIMNYKIPGLLRTIEELAKAEIRTTGAGNNMDEAHTPAILTRKGKRIAFYAYTDSTIPPGPGLHGEAKYNSPGVAPMDIEAVKNDVRNTLQYADYVIVSMHAGKEYTQNLTQFQKDFAHAAIDAGASIVIGHHPHVTQPIEYYKDGIIFYSLGNFVFDQFFSEDVQTGLVAKILLSEEDKPQAELYPVKIENTVPRIAEGEERERLLKKLGI